MKFLLSVVNSFFGIRSLTNSRSFLRLLFFKVFPKGLHFKQKHLGSFGFNFFLGRWNLQCLATKKNPGKFIFISFPLCMNCLLLEFPTFDTVFLLYCQCNSFLTVYVFFFAVYRYSGLFSTKFASFTGIPVFRYEQYAPYGMKP